MSVVEVRQAGFLLWRRGIWGSCWGDLVLRTSTRVPRNRAGSHQGLGELCGAGCPSFFPLLGSRNAGACLRRPVAPNHDLLPRPPPLPTHPPLSSGILMIPKSAVQLTHQGWNCWWLWPYRRVGWGGVRWGEGTEAEKHKTISQAFRTCQDRPLHPVEPEPTPNAALHPPLCPRSSDCERRTSLGT